MDRIHAATASSEVTPNTHSVLQRVHNVANCEQLQTCFRLRGQARGEKDRQCQNERMKPEFPKGHGTSFLMGKESLTEYLI
jgi:hypothetical protein